MEMKFRGMMITMTSTLLVAIMLLSSSATAVKAVANSDSTTATTGTMSMCRPGKVHPELAMECWSAIFQVPSCVSEILKVIGGGSLFDLGPPCCGAFLSLTEDCKIEVFQHSKFFPIIENFCAAVGGGGQAPPPSSV